jgi:hypothetical protein
MNWLFFNELTWEIVSLTAIAVFFAYHVIEYIGTKRYAMFKLLMAMLVASVALIISVKVQSIIVPYKGMGVVDIILAAAIAVVAFDFIVLFARACGLVVPSSLEKKLLWVIGGAYIAAGILLLLIGTQEQFVRLDRMVDVLLQPIWILLVIRLLFLSRKKQTA